MKQGSSFIAVSIITSYDLDSLSDSDSELSIAEKCTGEAAGNRTLGSQRAQLRASVIRDKTYRLVLTESALVVHVRGDTWRHRKAPGSRSPAAGLGHHTQVVPAKWSVSKLKDSTHSYSYSYIAIVIPLFPT